MTAPLRSWARALGGNISGRGVICPGPGHSRADRSLAVTPSFSAPDGFLVHSFAGDDFQTCRDHVRAKFGMPAFTPQRASPAPVQFCEASPRLSAEALAAPPPEPSPNTNPARNIWREAIDIKGTIAEAYLVSRGLQLDAGEDWHRILRFHPCCPFGTERAPAMIALMRDIITDEPRCIQRTRLTPDGCKIDRQMLGPAKGAAIKIDSSAKVSATLSIGEGLETCLSGRVQGFSPAWAVGSAGAIGAFPVLAGINRLNIFAERDENGTNERALLECASRWHAAGQDAVFAIRPNAGKDLNDELCASSSAADSVSFLAAVQCLWPGSTILTEQEKTERAGFQKELADIRAANARIYGHCGQNSNLENRK